MAALWQQCVCLPLVASLGFNAELREWFDLRMQKVGFCRKLKTYAV